VFFSLTERITSEENEISLLSLVFGKKLKFSSLNFLLFFVSFDV